MQSNGSPKTQARPKSAKKYRVTERERQTDAEQERGRVAHESCSEPRRRCFPAPLSGTTPQILSPKRYGGGDSGDARFEPLGVVALELDRNSL